MKKYQIEIIFKTTFESRYKYIRSFDANDDLSATKIKDHYLNAFNEKYNIEQFRDRDPTEDNIIDESSIEFIKISKRQYNLNIHSYNSDLTNMDNLDKACEAGIDSLRQNYTGTEQNVAKESIEHDIIYSLNPQTSEIKNIIAIDIIDYDENGDPKHYKM